MYVPDQHEDTPILDESKPRYRQEEPVLVYSARTEKRKGGDEHEDDSDVEASTKTTKTKMNMKERRREEDKNIGKTFQQQHLVGEEDEKREGEAVKKVSSDERHLNPSFTALFSELMISRGRGKEQIIRDGDDDDEDNHDQVGGDDDGSGDEGRERRDVKFYKSSLSENCDVAAASSQLCLLPPLTTFKRPLLPPTSIPRYLSTRVSKGRSSSSSSSSLSSFSSSSATEIETGKELRMNESNGRGSKRERDVSSVEGTQHVYHCHDQQDYQHHHQQLQLLQQPPLEVSNTEVEQVVHELGEGSVEAAQRRKEFLRKMHQGAKFESGEEGRERRGDMMSELSSVLHLKMPLWAKSLREKEEKEKEERERHTP